MQAYLKDGTLSTYFDNGKKSGEVTYKNSKPHGLWTEWYEKSQKHYEDNYEDGLLDRYSVTFRENGSKIKEENYKHSFCWNRTNHLED